jgi:hypothetical protein
MNFCQIKGVYNRKLSNSTFSKKLSNHLFIIYPYFPDNRL